MGKIFEYHWEDIGFFESWEFNDPNHPGSFRYIDMALVWALDLLRFQVEVPIITHWKVGGCVDVDGSHGHAPKSLHRKDQGGKAVDFHFKTDASPREQVWWVLHGGMFHGIGVYYDWHWNGEPLPIGFHVDLRPVERTQLWKRVGGEYWYLLK